MSVMDVKHQINMILRFYTDMEVRDEESKTKEGSELREREGGDQ